MRPPKASLSHAVKDGVKIFVLFLRVHSTPTLLSQLDDINLLPVVHSVMACLEQVGGHSWINCDLNKVQEENKVKAKYTSPVIY